MSNGLDKEPGFRHVPPPAMDRVETEEMLAEHPSQVFQTRTADVVDRSAERAHAAGLLSFATAEAYRRAVARTRPSLEEEPIWTSADAARALAGLPGAEENMVTALLGDDDGVRAAFRAGGGDIDAVTAPPTMGAGALLEWNNQVIPITWEVTRRRSADTGTLRTPVFSDRLSLENASRRRTTAKRLANAHDIEAMEAFLDRLDKLLVALGQIDADARPEVGGVEPPSDTDLIVALMEELEVELFHTPGGLDADCFATVPVSEHHEVLGVESRGFKRWVSREFHRKHNHVPSDTALQSAFNVLAALAQFDGPEHEVFVRRAFVNGKLYVDLADAEGQAVEIDGDGYRIVDPVACGVRFLRKNGMFPLPTPVGGGTVDELRSVVNVPDDDDWKLSKGFLHSCLHPTGPYLGLSVNGEHGSGKTWFSRTIRRTIDPSDRDLRRPITNEPDLAIAASTSLIVAVDNLSRLSDNLSDAYCSLATGAALSKRRLYTDFDECSVFFKRPVILNGINNVATRADLADRALPLHLPSLLGVKRRSERKLEEAFLEMHARVLGALFAAASAALRRRDEVEIDDPERMVDILEWVAAAEEQLGIEPGGFGRAYAAKVRSAAREALEDSPVAVETLALMEERRRRSVFEWEGTCKELNTAVKAMWGEGEKPPEGWPKSAQGIGRALRRAAPLLRREGVEVVEPAESARPRRYLLRICGDTEPGEAPSHREETSTPTGPGPSASGAGDDLDTAPDVLFSYETSALSPSESPESADSVVTDISDVCGAEQGSRAACESPADRRDGGREANLARSESRYGDSLGESPDEEPTCPPTNVGNVGNDGRGPESPVGSDSAPTFPASSRSSTTSTHWIESTDSGGSGDDDLEEETEWTA